MDAQTETSVIVKCIQRQRHIKVDKYTVRT